MAEGPPIPIPQRYRAICDICKNPNEPVDTRAEGAHQWTSGWVKNREGGGGHGISLPVRENRWAHSYCVEKKSRGQFGQQTLFG